ncbi:MAG: SpoIIE family protein phosphatase [Planctomycetota bacterium]|jgi:serine phosphatase RsbU (regulator of sigma subunit)
MPGRPPISIYRSLVTSFLVVILLLAGGLFAMTVFGARSAVRSFSATAMTQAADEVEARLARFFDPATRGLQMMRAWGRAGRLDFDDVEAFNAAFASVIETYPQITSLMLADDGGREFMLLRFGGKWINRSMDIDANGDAAEWRERASWGDEPSIEQRPKPGYDPRQRPWFKNAVAPRSASTRDETRWTAPYTFATTKDPGITGSVSFKGADGRARVVAFDLLLRDISRFTMSLQPTENGYGVVVTDDNRVLGLPGVARLRDTGPAKAALLKPPEQIGVEPVAAAMREFVDGNHQPEVPFEFTTGGAAWWGSVRWFDLASDRRLGVAVIVPESDLLGSANVQRLVIALVTSLAAAFAALYSIRLARRYSAPIRLLAQDSKRIQEGDLDKGAPIETRLAEVRDLAEAHDEMRVAVRTLLKLERDLQIARDIQQDTFPKRLPELAGYELDAWSHPAEETGGDSYDVVGLRQGHGIVERGADAVLLLLADASGHGIGPALSVAQVRAMLRMGARGNESVGDIATNMNEQLCVDLADDRFVTAWMGLLDATANTLTSLSAGQSPLLHFHAATGEVERRGVDGPPLGVVDGLPMAPKAPIRLAPGDLFLVMTDGIFEAHKPDQDEFGEQRVIDLLKERHTESPREILAALRAAAADYTDGRPQDDDQTAILIKRSA